MAKKKAGRPKKTPEGAIALVQLRCSPKQKRALVSRAHAAGLTLTEYILRKCLEE